MGREPSAFIATLLMGMFLGLSVGTLIGSTFQRAAAAGTTTHASGCWQAVAEIKLAGC